MAGFIADPSFSLPLCLLATSLLVVVCSGAAVDVEVGADTEDDWTAAAVAFALWVGEGCAGCALPSTAVFKASFSVSASLGDGDGEDEGLSLPELWTGDDCDVLDAV